MPNRYYIKEVDEGWFKFGESITESELKRRCLLMCAMYEKYGAVKIDILLNGYSKQDPPVDYVECYPDFKDLLKEGEVE